MRFAAAARASACAGQLGFTGRRVADTGRARLKQLALGVAERNANSATGTRTRVARVRAEYPNRLDYSGVAAIAPATTTSIALGLHRRFRRLVRSVSGPSSSSSSSSSSCSSSFPFSFFFAFFYLCLFFFFFSLTLPVYNSFAPSAFRVPASNQATGWLTRLDEGAACPGRSQRRHKACRAQTACTTRPTGQHQPAGEEELNPCMSPCPGS